VLVHPRFAEAWEQLRAWRTERAAGKPAYVVFDDKTLWLVAALLPTHEAGLLAISGIGPVKLENYGDDLIALAEKLRAG
jgi:DNA helicase-2/ATP-dependent DNA helicase PcrA